MADDRLLLLARYMGIETTPIQTHWNFLLAIEDDLSRLSRYVEFRKDNFKCYSLEIARIILASGAEVDVVCKQICENLDGSSSASNIHQYRDEIKPVYSQMQDFVVLMPRYGLRLVPWDEWKKTDGVPLWWTAYNKVKHHRDSEYSQANLHNALNAVAGLFVALLYLYKDKAKLAELVPSPELLRPDEPHFGGIMVNGYESSIRYVL